MNKTRRTRAPLVEIKAVTKAYKSGAGLFSMGKAQTVLALNSINLTLETGEILGLVGRSGSGKTTVGRLLVRLEQPSSGQIFLNGEPVNRLTGKALKHYRSRVQMIFQDPYQSLNPYLTIGQTILEPLSVHGMGTLENRRQKVLETLDTVGLTPAMDYVDRYPHQLSGGQRQRVAVARAIVLDPEVIVADEPTSMLDATIAIQLLHLLSRIRETKGLTFLFITHNLAAANYLCDRIAVINQGHIVEVNTARNIITRPEHPYTRELIRVQPGFDY